MATHEVLGQAPPLPEGSLLTADPALGEALARWTSESSAREVRHLATMAGSEPWRRIGEQADRNEPVLHTHSARGERIDEVDYHPAYHQLMDAAVGAGLTGEAWTAPPGSGAHVRRAAGFYVWSQVEAGHLCPVSMTYAAVPALRANPGLAEVWEPLLASRTYRPGLEVATGKPGAILGMGMTEKQGGSDVRSNTTEAVATGDADDYRLTGHKWFCSAPMSDGFLVLAQVEGAGMTCFLVPRVLPDGTRNPFALQRLKDKLGNRANASSEVELDGTLGWRVGDEGRGIRTILDMVAATRLDCVVGSAATMRQALVRALHHTRHRRAFGALLVDQPLMRNVLVDLALESEAAMVTGMRLAHAVDTGDADLGRLGVALGKFWVCKRTPQMVAEALECLGGNGYVEENGLARLYREAPLNSIWEGSGNVNALDVLRALAREPASVQAYADALEPARGHGAVLDRAITSAIGVARDPAHDPAAARRVVEQLALTLQAAWLVQHSPAVVADAFVASRLGERHGLAFGTLDPQVVSAVGEAVLERAVQV